MAEYIEREAAIAYIREQSEECQKAFEEFGGESGIYADAYNDLAEDFYRIPTADVAPVVRCKDCKHHEDEEIGMVYCPNSIGGWVGGNWFCADGERKDGADHAADRC